MQKIISFKKVTIYLHSKLLRMKKLFITLMMGALATTSFAQNSTEFGYNLGFSTYLGDLQPKVMTYKDPGFSTGIFVRHNINPFLSVRGFINYGRIHSSDANSADYEHMLRNLSFRSYILETGGDFEVSILPYDKFNPTNKKYKRYFNITPYFFGGLNIFHFNPKTFYKNEWVELQPLQTEGQHYSLTQIAIPFGMGIKQQFTKNFSVAIETGFRKTFTDYLDDVSGSYPDLVAMKQDNPTAAKLSFRGDELVENPQAMPIKGAQRGTSSNMDWYIMSHVSMIYKIQPKRK